MATEGEAIGNIIRSVLAPEDSGLADQLAAAIDRVTNKAVREAVLAERRACAAVAYSYDSDWPSAPCCNIAAERTADRIGDAICARGEP